MTVKPKQNDYDVIVMGGGPAGSTCATLLAKSGRSVLLLEKEHFPRHHIGESLIPETYWPLKKSGALEKIRNAGFTKKFSVQFANAKGKYSRPFYFFETNHHESAVTFQVTRAEFDKLLLDHARESGVDAIEGAVVKNVVFDGDRAVAVEAEFGSGNGAGPETRSIAAKVIVDATGLSALLASRLGIRIRDPRLRKACLYGYYKNARRDPGVDEGATLILKTEEGNGWFWFLPLADDVTSIGIVADPDYLFKNRGRDHVKIFEEEVEKTISTRERTKLAERVGEVHSINDFSYRSKRCAGPGYVLIGDAWGFLDPVYSTGVFLALKTAELAAESIDDAFNANDFSAERLGSFGPKVGQGIESFRKLVYAFYTPGFSVGQFMRKHPEYRGHLIDLLVGNVFRPDIDDIFEPMRHFADIPESLVGREDEAESASASSAPAPPEPAPTTSTQ